MNFLRCLFKSSSFGYLRQLPSYPHVQNGFSCTLGFFNTRPFSRYRERLRIGSSIRAFHRPYTKTCGLDSATRDVSKQNSKKSLFASYSVDRDVHDSSEPLQEEHANTMKKSKRNKEMKKFGPHEYEFDTNGYMSIDQLVKFLQQEAAFDICVIQTSGAQRAYVDYFVVVSGVSKRHIHAMAKNLEQLFRGQDVRGVGKDGHVSVEGLGSDSWLALDIGNMVVHFFLPEARAIYELEKLWSLGPKYDDQYKALLVEENFLKAVFIGEQREDQNEGF